MCKLTIWTLMLFRRSSQQRSSTEASLAMVEWLLMVSSLSSGHQTGMKSSVSSAVGMDCRVSSRSSSSSEISRLMLSSSISTTLLSLDLGYMSFGMEEPVGVVVRDEAHYSLPRALVLLRPDKRHGVLQLQNLPPGHRSRPHDCHISFGSDIRTARVFICFGRHIDYEFPRIGP